MELSAALAGRVIVSAQDGSVYAELDGLSISPVAMGDFADAIQHRQWMEQHKAADRFMLDTGWQLP